MIQQIVIKLLSLQPRDDGSGDIAIDAMGFVQALEDDGLTLITEEAIPGAHKTVTVSSTAVIAAVDGLDPVTQRAEAEAALFALALSVAQQDPDFAANLLEAKLIANEQAKQVVSLIQSIMGTGVIEVPVQIGQ